MPWFWSVVFQQRRGRKKSANQVAAKPAEPGLKRKKPSLGFSLLTRNSFVE